MRAAALLVITACGRVGFDAPDALVATPPTATSRITLAAPPAQPLDDFPLLLVLDDSRIDRARLRADASDLRVLAADGTVLPLELDELGPPLLAWVRVPQLDATTTLTLAYGYATPPPPATAPVWPASYEAVWHMTGDGTLRDSSTHGRDAVQTLTTDQAGIVGRGRRFDTAQESHAIVADGMFELPTATLSAWFQYRIAAGGTSYYNALNRELGDAAQDDFLLGSYQEQPAVIINTTNGDKLDFGNGPAFPPSTWIHIAATWDGATLTLYTNGVAGTTGTGGGKLRNTFGPVYIGCGRNNTNGTTPVGVPDVDFLDGALDELRIESVARSAAWLAFDVAAMQDGVLAYGPVP